MEFATPRKDIPRPLYKGDPNELINVCRESSHLDEGDVVRAGELINQGIDINYQEDNCKWSALMFAVKKGNKDLVRLLLDEGANINLVNCNGRTAIILAIEHNREEIVKMLLDMNPPPILEPEESGAFSPLLFAVRFSTPEVVRMLVNSGMKTGDAMEMAIKSSDQEMIDALGGEGSHRTHNPWRDG